MRISHGIHCGDCITGMKSMPNGCADLVFADPPFNIGFKYDKYKDSRPDQEYLDWSRDWMREVHRVLKPDGSFWLAIGDKYAADLKTIAHRELGFSMRNWVIWHFTFGPNQKAGFTPSHTHLLYFVKNPKAFTFNSSEILVPSARQLVYNDKRANSKGRNPDDTWILRPQDSPDSFRADSDTWYVPRLCGTHNERTGWHPCQMPEALLERIVKVSSSPGELVFDPFVGSGTSLVIARKLDRKVLGFEISEEYAARAGERLTQVGL